MRVIGLGVDAGFPYAHAAAVMLRCVIDQTFADRPGVMPHHTAGLRVQSIHIVGSGDDHESVYYHRGDFHIVRSVRVENPLSAQLRDIFYVYLVKATEALPGVVAVVGEPIIRDGAGS